MSGERRNRERDIDGMRRGHKAGFCGYLPSFRGQELIKEMEKDNQENVQKVERKGFQGGMANGPRHFYKVRKNLAGQEKQLNLVLRVSFKSTFLGEGNREAMS